jgi:predicted Fe-Mo cluster-binding NifX family protein
MRIAVITQGKDLEAQVDSRFGTAPNLILNERKPNMER